MNRREFFSNTLWLAGASVLASGLATGLSAQAQGKPAYRPGRYDDLLIFERKPFTWPDGKTLAIWIAPNVEVWDFNSAVGTTISSPTGGVVPDVINYAWRDYGMRVGLWRIADALDVLGVRATVALNSGVCETFPKAVEEMNRRGWEFMGHGISNSTNLAKLSLDQERQVIREVLRTIEQATGKRPRGWLGPGLAETFNTPDILAEEGVQYLGDWNNDDQPYPMKVKQGKLFSIPYCMELNDTHLLNRNGYTGEQYLKALTGQFDMLYSESGKTARVMGIPLHPYLVGQPLHTAYLKKALAYMKSQERVWFATGSEIIEAYQRVAG